MISQGIPMLLMGDEYLHTRNGNNNAWSQDNELNWFLWDKLEEQKEFYAFYRFLINFRKTHPLLRLNYYLTSKEVKWHGLIPEQPKWEIDDHFVAFSLHFPDSSPGLYIAFNASHIYQNVIIPSPGEGKAWQWVVNTANPLPKSYFDKDILKLDNLNLRMSPYSSLMLRSGA